MSKEISKEDLHAVIAAAVHSVLDEPFRIVSVEPEIRARALRAVQRMVEVGA